MLLCTSRGLQLYSVCASKPVVIAWDALIMCSCVQAMVDIVKHGLNDENQKVKTITALTVSALAEAASPYGIESFDDVLEPLWKGIRLLRGKVSCCLMFSLYLVNCQLVCMQHPAPDWCNRASSAESFGRCGRNNTQLTKGELNAVGCAKDAWYAWGLQSSCSLYTRLCYTLKGPLTVARCPVCSELS